jgi:hypothetical protein
MFIIAQIVGFIASGVNIFTIQIKQKKYILLGFMTMNLLFAINFILLQSYSGAIISFISAIQTLINYVLEKKEIPFPKWLIPVYLVVSFVCGMATYQSFVDILPVTGSILYTLSIIQKKEKNLRRITLANTILWLIYDLLVMAYSSAISEVFFLTSNLIAIYRYDIRKQKEETFTTK